MSKISIEGNASGTGTLTIAAPNTNTNRTLNLPDSTGTIVLTQAAGGVSTNTAVGTDALAANTTGANNTAVGYQALDANTTGAQNTAVGSGALGANTTGQFNTAVGYSALLLNTTGIRNTAVGRTVLEQNTSGTYNTGLGMTALGSNTTGSYNTALGNDALLSNTTGANNTAVGYSAGSSITTQSNNVYIGYNCGASQVGSGGIFIGANAFSGYNGDNQVSFKTGDGREALYADIGGGGSFRQYSNSSSWATVSDQRIKENVIQIENGLEKIVALRPVEFDYITNKEHSVGFIAQEFKNVLPDQVKKTKARPEEAELIGETEIYNIQQNLVPYLVKAIQELSAQVTALQAEVESLKNPT